MHNEIGWHGCQMTLPLGMVTRWQSGSIWPDVPASRCAAFYHTPTPRFLEMKCGQFYYNITLIVVQCVF